VVHRTTESRAVVARWSGLQSHRATHEFSNGKGWYNFYQFLYFKSQRFPIGLRTTSHDGDYSEEIHAVAGRRLYVVQINCYPPAK